MSTTRTCFGRPPSLLFHFLIALLALSMASGCSDAGEPDPGPSLDTTTPDSGAGSAVEKAATGKPEARNAPRNPNERPMPSFEGTTLSGTKLRIADMLGSRLVLLLFNPEVELAKPVAEAVVRVAALRGEHNFEVVGVGIGSNPSALSRFVESQKLDFPVIDDSSGEITQKLRLRAPVAVIGMDADGYMSFGMGGFPEDGNVAQSVESSLRENLRLPPVDDPSTDGTLIAYPRAPTLGVSAMSSSETLETTDLAGRAALVIFFLHTCPHCHKALEAIRPMIEDIEEDKRPRLVAISLNNTASAVRRALAELGLDYFDPYLDPGQQATERWGVTGGVPAIFVVDPEGRIRHHSTGWEGKRDAGLLRMKLAQAAGARVPMLLDPAGYSGNDVCGVCHEQEYATWEYTSHSNAFDTLVAHSADRRTDCVGCHVVGFEEKGGYDFARRPAHLENVGCESCHGRGGPHLSPGFVTEGDYQAVCATCHNKTHSLGFDYDAFHPRISHDVIAAMSKSERKALAGDGGPKRDLLPTQGEYVGSNACQSCHPAEFETWEKSAHGHAVATLEAQGKAGEPECLQCHTTAYAKPGGFPADAAVSAHPDLARVGCESCHGPGSEHIGESARRVGTILSLGDKCDSCVILKICGTCHDDANDPGFEFKVEERIEAQRHGTIEAAATRDGSSAAAHPKIPERLLELAGPRPIPAASSGYAHDDRILLDEAFERLERHDALPDPG